MPALFQFRNTHDGSELSVDLCLVHLQDAQKAVKEMQTLREEDPPYLISQEPQGHE